MDDPCAYFCPYVCNNQFFSPGLTQMAYRIGDSGTNPIVLINYFIPIIIAVMEKYKKEGDDRVRKNIKRRGRI